MGNEATGIRLFKEVTWAKGRVGLLKMGKCTQQPRELPKEVGVQKKKIKHYAEKHIAV